MSGSVNTREADRERARRVAEEGLILRGLVGSTGDLDLTIYWLRTFCRRALKGSPTALLLFFVAGEHLLARTPTGAELQALAPAFLSKRTGRAFLGYLGAQRRGQRLVAASDLPARPDHARVDRFLVEAYGRGWSPQR